MAYAPNILYYRPRPERGTGNRCMSTCPPVPTEPILHVKHIALSKGWIYFINFDGSHMVFPVPHIIILRSVKSNLKLYVVRLNAHIECNMRCIGWGVFCVSKRIRIKVNTYYHRQYLPYIYNYELVASSVLYIIHHSSVQGELSQSQQLETLWNGNMI